MCPSPRTPGFRALVFFFKNVSEIITLAYLFACFFITNALSLRLLGCLCHPLGLEPPRILSSLHPWTLRYTLCCQGSHRAGPIICTECMSTLLTASLFHRSLVQGPSPNSILSSFSLTQLVLCNQCSGQRDVCGGEDCHFQDWPTQTPM